MNDFFIIKKYIYLWERERKISVCFYNVLYSFLIFQMELLFCVPKLWGSLWDIVQVYLIISFYINETAKKKYVILIKLLWNYNNNVSLLWTDNAFCKYQFPILIILSTISFKNCTFKELNMIDVLWKIWMIKG